MIDTKELVPIKTQVTKIEREVSDLTIATQADYTIAVDVVSRIKEIGKNIKERKEGITKPLNEALKSARELFAPIEAQYANAETIIKTKLLDYKRRIDEEARIEEAKIAARVEKGTLKVETAERKIESIERVESTTKGERGEIQVRKVKKVRIVDEKLLPREYLIPNETLIRKDALLGKVIAGVEIYEDEIIAAR